MWKGRFKGLEIKTHIYESENFKEKEFKEYKKQLKTNDVLIIKTLSAIGKTREDIQKELTSLTKKIKVDLVVLDMPLFDTRINKEINGTLIADLVIQTLVSSTELDKNIRKERQSEGIAKAKSEGTKFGRPKVPYPKGFNKVYNKVLSNQLTKSQAARELDITFHQMSRFIERKTNE